MGGCTSKPKVLNDDEVLAPETAPEKVIEEEEDTMAVELAPQEKPEKVTEEEKETMAVELAPQEEPEKVVKKVEVEVDDPEPTSEKVVEEEKEIVNEVVKEMVEVERANEESNYSSESGTIKDDENKKVKSQEEQTTSLTHIKEDEIKPAVETENAETLDKRHEEKAETSGEKKQEEAKSEPEKIPIFSFFTSLMSQKH